jgi:hypothetical protein
MKKKNDEKRSNKKKFSMNFFSLCYTSRKKKNDLFTTDDVGHNENKTETNSEKTFEQTEDDATFTSKKKQTRDVHKFFLEAKMEMGKDYFVINDISKKSLVPLVHVQKIVINNQCKYRLFKAEEEFHLTPSQIHSPRSVRNSMKKRSSSFIQLNYQLTTSAGPIFISFKKNKKNNNSYNDKGTTQRRNEENEEKK